MSSQDYAVVGDSPTGQSLTNRLIAIANARWGAWLLILLLVPTAIVQVRTSLTKPFWFDELCTVAVAGLGNPRAIWNALAQAVDGQPPFFHFVTAVSTRIVPDTHLGYRLPGLIAFLLVPLSLHAFVSRRVGAMGGLVAALVALLSGLEPYASEARPYSLEVGCFALALVFWQRLETSARYALPFGLSLAAAVASHYYAVIALPAFAVGEAVRWYRTGRFRASAWIPLVTSVVPLLIAAPLMAAFRNVYGTHFWARNRFQALPFVYQQLTTTGPLFTVGLVFVLVLLAGALMMPIVFSRTGFGLDRVARRVLPEDCAAAIVLLCMPVLAYVANTVIHGGLVPRYVLPGVLGIAIVSGFASSALGTTFTAAALAALIASYGYNSLIKGLTVFRGQAREAKVNSDVSILERMLRDIDASAPVVISSGGDYVPLAYYSGPDLRKRILTLVDPAGALQTIKTDSVDREEVLLASYLPLDVQDFSTFRQAHRRFFLFSSGDSVDWWPARLLREGHSLKVRKLEGEYRLYEVELRPVDQ